MTVSPLRPSFSPQPRVYPRRATPRFARSTTNQPLPTFPRPFFSYTYEMPLRTHRFPSSSFSVAYKSLFQQLLCFDNYLRRPMFFQFALVSELCALCASAPNSFPVTLLRTLGRSQKTQLLCNQANPRSFGKTPGVGIPRHSSLLQGMACSISHRWRLLPQTRVRSCPEDRGKKRKAGPSASLGMTASQERREVPHICSE